MNIFLKISSNFSKKHYKYLGNFALAQIFVLSISPLFSRIYTPSDLGMGSLFITTNLILGSLSTLSFENSVFIEKDKDSIYCILISFLICCTFSCLISFVPINYIFKTFFNANSDIIFQVLLPLGAFLVGVNNILKSLCIKKGLYQLLGSNKVLISVLIPSLTIYFGISKYSYRGIIYSFFVGFLVINIYLLFNLKKYFLEKLNYLNLNKLNSIFIKNTALVFWTMPSNFINNLSSYLPVLFISNLFGSSVLGQYELALKAYSFPIGIFMTTIKDIFKEKISNALDNDLSPSKVFNTFFEILLKISVFILLPITLVFPYIFQIIFGSQWSEGGFYIHYLIPLLCINFVSSPLSIILILRAKQKLDFIWQIFFLIVTTLSFVIPSALNNDISIQKILFIYSLGAFIMYAIALKISYGVSRLKILNQQQEVIKNNLCHLTLTNFKNETRIIKQIETLKKINHLNKIFVFAIYKKSLKEKEIIDENIFLIRLKLFSKNLSNNLVSQFVKYIEMVFRVIFLIYKNNINIIVIHSLALLPLSVLLKFFFKIKIIYDCHELETETYGLSKIRKLIAKLIEYCFIRFANLILVVSPSIENWYKRKYKLENIITILNTPNYPLNFKDNYLRRKFQINQKHKLIIYVGAILEGRSINELIEIFSKLDKKDMSLVFLGYGDLVPEVKVAQKKFKNIFYHEAVNINELVKIISSADIGVAYINNGSKNDDFCLPNKFFEYIYSGIPVITSSSPDMIAYINKYNFGISINKLSCEELLNAIYKISNMNQESLNERITLAQKELNWTNESIKLINAMQKYKLI